MKCHAKYDTADIMANLDNEPDPHCHRRLPYSGNMPCNGLIKTDVVYFGEALPDGALENHIDSQRRPTNCGSSDPRWKSCPRQASCP